jgi:hypothetical protein
MSSRMLLIAGAIVASATPLSLADGIEMDFRTGLGTQNIYRVWTGGGNSSWSSYSGGALQHNLRNGTGRFDSPLYEGNARYTFCTDLEGANSGYRFYEARQPVNAPLDTDGNPGENGSPYSATESDRLNAWAAACLQLGLINSQGFFVLGNRTINAGSTVYTQEDLGMAVQFGVWDSLWDDGSNAPWDHTLGMGETRLNNEVYLAGSYAGLQNVRNIVDIIAGFAAPKLGQGYGLVRILVNRDEQDQMILVPLPPAAWAGLASLAGIGAFGYVRRRSFRA